MTTVWADRYPLAIMAANHEGAVKGARLAVPLILAALPQVTSVADFGCGLGSWLRVFAQYEIAEYDGFDGPWTDQAELFIPPQHFHPVDLREDVSLTRCWDLALCLEVAEHLPKEAAEQIVATVTQAAPIVFWSAATPGQGGWYHENERPLAYWERLFARRGFAPHLLPGIAKLPGLPAWYRQARFYTQGRSA